MGVVVQTLAEEVAEEGHRRLHSYESLAVESKDGQEQDRVGLEMKGLDPVVFQDGGEERGERRHQPDKDAMEEEGVYRLLRGPLLYGARPDQGPPVLLGLGRIPWKHGNEIHILGKGALQERRRQGMTLRLCLLLPAGLGRERRGAGSGRRQLE